MSLEKAGLSLHSLSPQAAHTHTAVGLTGKGKPVCEVGTRSLGTAVLCKLTTSRTEKLFQVNGPSDSALQLA